jgi:hypothetical protein
MLEKIKAWCCRNNIHFADGYGLIIAHVQPELTPTSDICYCEWCGKKQVIETNPDLLMP